MKGVYNQGFGDVLLENFGNDDVFFNFMVGVILMVDMFLRFFLWRLFVDLEFFDWLNCSMF